MSSAFPLPEEWLNPFPGLRPFEPDEDYLFFGRERQTDELLRRLRTTRFLSILGTSGSGKSSLVRSGLIPTLYGGGMTAAGSRWRVAIMRPGDDPLANLAAALSAPEALGNQSANEELKRDFFETTLRASDLGIVECVQEARIAPRDNVLVLIDQFEELFRYKRSRRATGRDDAAAFVKLLLAARESDAPIYIALTMRSDFIGDCMEFGDLPEAINNGVYLVSRMTRDELRLAITGPVAVGGATIAPRLVSRLLNNVGDDPDQLPILQHALMRTWEAWTADHAAGEPLDLRHYEAIGTMHTALSRHAEEAFAELDANEQVIAEKLFKALTDKETDVRGVRRPAPVVEICALTGATLQAVTAVIDRFREKGRTFLMPPAGTPLQDDSIVDISHESLMRVWTRLSQWADDESRSAQTYVRVAHAAELHEQGAAALWRDPELQLALTWRDVEKPTNAWAARYDESFDRAIAFLDASRDERDREVREKEMRRRVLVTILAVASLVIAAFGLYAFVQKRKAETAQRVAVIARTRAEEALVRVKEAQARAYREKSRAEDQERFAVYQAGKAKEARANAEEQTILAKQQTTIAQSERQRAEAERLNAVAKEAEARTQKTNAETARSQAVEEKTKAVASEKETRRLSHLAAARALALSIVSHNPANAAVLALETERLHRESGGRPQDPNIFTAMRIALGPWEPAIRRGYDDAVRALAIAPDRHTLFTGGDDGSISRLDLDDEKGKPSLVARIAGPVRSLSVRGDLLVVGTASGLVAVLNLRNPQSPPRELAKGGAPVTSVAFQPSGSLLAAGGQDGSLRLWNVNDAAAPPTAIRIAGVKRVSAVAFSPDGRKLAAGISDGEGILAKGVRLWRVEATGNEPERACGDEDIRSIAFRPDSRVLACGTRDGRILQDALGSSAEVPTPLFGHVRSVNSLTFDPGGDYLASAGSDGTVRIWDAKTPNVQAIVLPGHDSWVWGVAFAPNGKRLISGGQDRTVRLWSAKTSVLAEELCKLIAPGKHYPSRLTSEEWSATMPADLPYRDEPICGER